jgi:hypothetical protein
MAGIHFQLVGRAFPDLEIFLRFVGRFQERIFLDQLILLWGTV